MLNQSGGQFRLHLHNSPLHLLRPSLSHRIPAPIGETKRQNVADDVFNKVHFSEIVNSGKTLKLPHLHTKPLKPHYLPEMSSDLNKRNTKM